MAMINRCPYANIQCSAAPSGAECNVHLCVNYKPASAPVEKEEWVDCTVEVFNKIRLQAFDMSNSGDKNWYCGWSAKECPAVAIMPVVGQVIGEDYRVVYRDGEPRKEFRIERRVEKPAPPVFKIGDKVRYDGREWTIVGFDDCAPPCAVLFDPTYTASYFRPLCRFTSGCHVPGYDKSHRYVKPADLEAIK
jgi:hypothetical protein